jgi:predicted NACHT family NTPase
MESLGIALAELISKNSEKLLKSFSGKLIKLDEKLRIKIRLAYAEYLKNSYSKISKSKSFFFRNQSQDLYSYYVPSGISCGNITISKPDIENCLAHSSHIAITGYGGSGKSILLKHLFLDTIRKGKFVPVLVELRDLNQGSQNLAQLIETNLNNLGFETSGDFVKLAKAEGHLAFFLDGYDEVIKSQRKKLINDIKALSSKSSSCPMFLTSRPDDVFFGLSGFDVYSIEPLSIDSATELVSKLPVDSSLKSRFISEIPKLYASHESFLSNPLLLSIMLLTYGENAEIPVKLSVFYNQAFEVLFQRHDALKEGFRRERLTNLDIQDFSKVFSAFCLQTYHRGIFKAPNIEILRYIRKSREALEFSFDDSAFMEDLLVSVCLLVEDGLEISFTHRSFQEYFTALHIKNSNPEAQKILIKTFWPDKNKDEIFNLLYELDNELVEREIIIPGLTKFFNEIGLKKKVGITHFVKYMKICYSEIIITRESTRASGRHEFRDFKELLKIINRNHNPYGFPVADIEKIHNLLYKNYGDGDNEVVFLTSDLSIRSPLILDLAEHGEFFSKAYLECLLNFSKDLQERHKNPRKKIDFLLSQVT